LLICVPKSLVGVSSFCNQQTIRKAASILNISDHVLAKEFVLMQSGKHFAMPICKTNRHLTVMMTTMMMMTTVTTMMIVMTMMMMTTMMMMMMMATTMIMMMTMMVVMMRTAMFLSLAQQYQEPAHVPEESPYEMEDSTPAQTSGGGGRTAIALYDYQAGM
jgi:hypothetical protein